jgi:hypothetical protein
MCSEGYPSHSVGCNSPLQIKMAIWRTFKNNLICWEGCGSPLQTVTAVWLPSNLKNVRQTAITICSGQAHPTRLLSRIVCRGQEAPKGSKNTLRPDFQANTRPMLF